MTTITSNRRVSRKLCTNLTKSQTVKQKQEGDIWHRRIGHISSSYLGKLSIVTKRVIDLIYDKTTANGEICSQSKMTRIPI